MSEQKHAATDAALPDGCALLDPLPSTVVRMSFDAAFEGSPIEWNATLEALGTATRAFIEVEEAFGGQGRIRVGLPVPTIDHATVHKCVIMVRQYRALRRGRHEFASGLGGQPR